jgi:hypothetical protein
MRLGTKKDHIVYRRANCKGSPVQLFFKEIWTMDLAFSLKNLLSLQLLLNPLGDFGETLYREGSHCGVLHILREALPNFLKKCYYSPMVLAFSLEDTVFLTYSKPLGGDETWHKERSHCVGVPVCIIRGAMSNYR